MSSSWYNYIIIAISSGNNRDSSIYKMVSQYAYLEEDNTIKSNKQELQVENSTFLDTLG